MVKAMTEANAYAAILRAPFAALGITATDSHVTGITFLPAATRAIVPKRNTVAELACVELNEYLDRPRFRFQVPIHLVGSLHQIKVWRALQTIAPGSTQTYGDVAARIDSAARAVGGACGANPIPIIVPCHRVLAAGGKIGGFMRASNADTLSIKHWLLAHEGVLLA